MKGNVIMFVLLGIMSFSLISAEELESVNLSEYEDLPSSASDIGVEYDSILKYQFLVSKWVYVSVDVKDFSNITVDYGASADVQKEQDDARWDVYRNTTDAILSTLSDDEFHLKSKSPWGSFFSGNITKQGFDKLLNDTRVRKVYAKKNFELLSSGALFHEFILTLAVVIILITIILLIKIKFRRVGRHAEKK